MSAQGKSGTAHPQERMSAFRAVADSLCTLRDPGATFDHEPRCRIAISSNLAVPAYQW
jgi:hypothetical protein